MYAPDPDNAGVGIGIMEIYLKTGKLKRSIIAALAVLLLPLVSMAQFSISGTVSENANKVLSGTSVRLKNKAGSIITDTQGKYQFNNLKAGNYTLTVSYIGYQTVEKTINLSADETVDFVLNPVAFLADEVIVKATRASEKSATTYKNIRKEEIESNNFGQDLPFILNNTPGVVVTSDAGAGVGYTGIRIRGSDASRINVTINGIPYNDSESQGTFWVNMPDFASSVDNIQIQRGIGTSTNGAGAFGGSLNIQTSSTADVPYAELNNTFGSFNTWKNTVKVGTGLIDNKWSFDGRLSRIKSDGFVDRSASDLKSYFLSGAYHGKNELLRINVFAGSEKTYQAWNGVPEAKLRGDVVGLNTHYNNNIDYLYYSDADRDNLFNSDNRTYNQFTYSDQTDNYWQSHYQAIYAKQFNAQFSFNGALHYTDGKGYFEEFKQKQEFGDYGLPNPEINGAPVEETDLVRRRWLDNDFYGLTYAFNYQPQANLTFTLGGAYNEYKGKHFGQIIWSQVASTLNNSDHYYDNKANKADFNIYGKVNYNLAERLSLFADLQYRKVTYSIAGTEKNINELDINDNLNFFNPKFGATYTLDQNSNIYGSFSVAKKEPNRDDYINIETGAVPKAESLNNVETGYRFKSSRLQAGVNLYGMFYKDQLVVTGKINDVGEYYRQNVDKSYRIGAELDASYQISKQFVLNANAAFSRNKVKNFTEFFDDYDNGGQQTASYSLTDISFSPNQVLFGELVYKPLSGLAVALQSKYVGKQYMDNTQNESRKLDAYWVNNARLGYDFGFKGVKNINIGLLANNILNKKYESNGYTYRFQSGGSMVTENFYFPQAGTNFLLSLNLKF